MARTTPKRSFTSFVTRNSGSGADAGPAPGQPQTNPEPALVEASATRPDREPDSLLSIVSPPPVRQPLESRAGEGASSPDRTKVVTSTGRVRTYTASRNLPGVTLRLTEARWERLKLLSIQERRPIQEILGEAVDAYMRGRGLQW
jgi:hypothetical protein